MSACLVSPKRSLGMRVTGLAKGGGMKGWFAKDWPVDE